MAQMTSRERIFAALTMSEVPDRLPVVPLLMTRGIREGGLTAAQALRDGEASAHAKIKALQTFGGDVVIAGTDLFTPVECLGAELEYMDYAQPTLVAHPAPDKEAFYRLRDRYAKEGFVASDRIHEIQREAQTFVKLGYRDTHAIPTPVGGPITTASLMVGTSEFLALISDEPEYADEVIEVAFDAVKNVCRLMLEAGIDAVNILDPTCSSDVLSPDLYRAHGWPYHKRLFDYIHGELKGVGFLHICTYTQPIWQDIVKTGAVNFNGDMYPGADYAKKEIGDKISLMGTLSPYSTLVHGSPEDVAKEVKKLALEVGYNGGFVVMPGCDIDWSVPAANLKALCDTAASITYPIDPEALGDLSDAHIAGHPEHRGKRASSAHADARVLAIEGGLGTVHGAGSSAGTPTARTNGDGAQREERDEILAGLIDAVLTYDGDKAVELTQRGLAAGLPARDIVFDGLALGMRVIGDMYERNERFVVDMVKGWRAMDKALAVLGPAIDASRGGEKAGTVILGLVRGNTQDLGKNLVGLMLRANGYEVVDLGKNVKPEQFIAAAAERGADAIAVSVMTNSSVAYVEQLVEQLKAADKGSAYLVMFGGAGATPTIGKQLGIRYGVDANEAVEIMHEHMAAARA